MIAFGILLCLAALTNAANHGRVIGGSDAPEHKYPYQVSFRERSSTSDFHFCSGSILNKHWLLTAAHCFENRKLDNTVAVAGTNYLSEMGESYKIQFYVIHEDYKVFNYDDICLVRIVGEILFSENVKAIALPTENRPEETLSALFAGWGSIKLWGPSASKLQEINLNVIPNSKCAVHHQITDKHICTYTKAGEGICHGDSGGPLVVDGAQVGIASYVAPCAVGYPDVYTRVYSFVDWIQKTQAKFA